MFTNFEKVNLVSFLILDKLKVPVIVTFLSSSKSRFSSFTYFGQGMHFFLQKGKQLFSR